MKTRHLGQNGLEVSASGLGSMGLSVAMAAPTRVRDVEKDVLHTCKDLGIGFVPFSPLGRATLIGRCAT